MVTNILYSNTLESFGSVMEKNNKNQIFPIEEKLAAIEYSLKLLNTSITITHTPLRTLKSMIKGNIVQPTIEKLEKLADFRI